MSDAQKIIAVTVERHQFIPRNHSSIGSEDHCRCGHRPVGWSQYAAHVAAEIDTALGGLKRETRVIEGIFEMGVPEPATRFVTYWMEIPHE
jgi:hypothetical protein